MTPSTPSTQSSLQIFFDTALKETSLSNLPRTELICLFTEFIDQADLHLPDIHDRFQSFLDDRQSAFYGYRSLQQAA